MADKVAIRWCAVYTRKSSEEGLEQEFNSLHAQREAGEAYVKSQQHEGWRLVPAKYDDGGCSGANLERPALKRLVADIRAGKVHIVVVYKVDRLTRSLADFAKLIEVFEARAVSFVSVTQQFNTTTSMGRLMLNVLLSFAQFEREVTGERIRDKIAAAKRKGMWMGGTPPIGYDLGDRKLLVNVTQAEVVRHIFRRYAALGSVVKLFRELKAQGYCTKCFTSSSGRLCGGKPFSRGHLYRILQNRVYLGEVVYRDQAHRGEHAAIVNRELWDPVQQLMAHNRRERARGSRFASCALLRGLVFDDAGNRMTPVHASKEGRRYRYYVSQALLQHREHSAGSLPRLPAYELEKLVSDRTWETLERDARTKAALSRFTAGDEDNRSQLLRVIIKRIEAAKGVIRVQVDPAALLSEQAVDSYPKPITVEIAHDFLKGTGGTQIVAHGDSSCPSPHPNRGLIKAVVRGQLWRDQLLSGEVKGVGALARKVGVSSRYITRIVRLGFLAPDIVAAILEGRQPAALTLESFRSPLPLGWGEQRSLLAFR